MNYRMIGNIIGKVVCVEAAFMLPALLISLCSGETASAWAFFASFLIMLAVALPFALSKPKKTDIFARDGLLSVGLIWIIVSLFGALPYFFSGAIGNYVDCVFETVSGFTTTGASILRDVEVLPKGILYWRSFTNWLGGMGVLVFVLILNPLSAKDSGGNMHLLRAESPGVKISKLVPRMKQSAAILYLIYIILTLLLFVLLLCGRVNVFDAITLSFSTAGTGGFSVRNASVGAYSAYVQWLVGVFMLLFSINFNVYFLMLIGGVRKALRSEETKVLFSVVLLSTAVIALNLRGSFGNLGETLRAAFFQVATVLSTTGFATENFDLWPQLSRTILVLLMFLGGSGGSTAGGLKICRAIIVIKSAARSVKKMIFPSGVKLVRLDGETLREDTVNTVQGYALLYFLSFLAGMLLVSVDGFDLQTNLTASLACLSNVGPGLGAVGPTMNYADFSVFSKIVLSLLMLIGRLELYPMLALFVPAAWKK